LFAERPDQLGQEEVYVALKGSGMIVIDDAEHPLDAEHVARVGPEHRRKVLPGPDGLRVLILGGTPG
jgi:mannose-6-phosphate isomerase-like protein (cupin superfamily)